MAYSHSDDARNLRENIYLNKSEKELLQIWADTQGEQRSALIRRKLVEIAANELKRVELRQGIVAMACVELKKQA